MSDSRPNVSPSDDGEPDQPLPPAPPKNPLPRTRQEPPDDFIDRGAVIGAGVRSVGRWSWSIIGIMLATAALFWVLAKLQVGLIPIMLAIIICTVLNPLKRGLEKIKVPTGLAAAIVLLAAVAVVGGLLASVAPGIVEQISAVVSSAGVGLQQLQRWLAGPPLNVNSEQLQDATAQVTQWLQGQAANIATGFVTGITTVGSVLITLFLVLVLTFFFLKDGSRFLPAVRHMAGRRGGQHLSEVLSRVWNTLGAFIRTQAIVGAIDAVLIGLGLVILNVPLAMAIAILTFLFSFIPTLGAIVAGALAVLVALVSNGFTSALWVLLIVLAVQQIESNIIFPVLQRRSVDVHPAISLVSVAIGGTTFGIMGAFLAVPVVATALVVLRYLSEQVDVVSGERDPNDIRVVTPDGALAAAATAQLTKLFRRHTSEEDERETPESPALTAYVPLPPGRFNNLTQRFRRRGSGSRGGGGSSVQNSGSTEASAKRPKPESREDPRPAGSDD